MSESTRTVSGEERSGKTDNEELDQVSAAPEAQANAAPEGGADVATQGTPKTEDETAKAFADLESQLAREKERAQQADTLRQNAEAEAARLRDAVQRGEISLKQANLIALQRAAEATDAQITGLKGELTYAFQSGDMARAADLQAALSEAAARKVQLEAGRQQLERTQEVPQQRDPYEAALAQYTPRTQAWLRQHPEIVRDQATGNKALMAHNAVVAQGHVIESDAYFDAMDKALGYKADAPSSASRPAPRPAPALAPSKNGSLDTRSKIKEARDMSPRMMQLARESDMKPEEWLRNYNDLLAAGQIDPIH